MRLTRDVKGVSKLILIILLLVSFILGSVLSYIWTMGYYAPQEFHLPSQANIAIENAEFFAENANFFNVTVLNPSYSPSNVTINQFLLSAGGVLLNATSSAPSLPYELAPGISQTFQIHLNWGNYTRQTVTVIAVVADGSGATVQAITPFMNLTIASVDFYPEVSATYFNATLESTGSKTFVDIKSITVNGVEVSTIAPTLPYRLDPNASVTLKLESNWADLQGKPVTVGVTTYQGYETHTTRTAPAVVLSIEGVVFNINDTMHFSVTILNQPFVSRAKVDITQVTVYVSEQVISITVDSPPLPQPLQPGSVVLLSCSWNWTDFKGQTVMVTVETLQGFAVSAEATTPQM